MWQLRSVGVKLGCKLSPTKAETSGASRPTSFLEFVINYFVFLGSNPQAHQLKSTISVMQHDLALVVKIHLSSTQCALVRKNYGNHLLWRVPSSNNNNIVVLQLFRTI